MDVLVKPIEFDQAVKKLSEKTPIGALLRSAEWAEMPLAIRERAFFSSTVESARVAQELRDKVLSVASPSEFVTKTREFMRAYGLGREAGGDGRADNADLTNLAGTARLKLIYEQNLRSARGHAWWKQGQHPDVLDAFPAQELLRLESRAKPRDWQARWTAAGGRVFDGRMIALKSDPIWREISRFGTPWPPYDFGSGMGVEDVDREEAEALGLLKPDEPVKGDEAGFNDDLQASVKNLDPDLTAMVTSQLRDIFGQAAVELEDGVLRWRGSREPVVPTPAPVAPTPTPVPVPTVEDIRKGVVAAKTRQDAHAALALPQSEQAVWKPGNRPGPKIAAAAKTGQGFLAQTVHRDFVPKYTLQTSSGRGHYTNATRIAKVRPDAANVVHEIAHAIEHQFPGVYDACREFLLKRAAGGPLRSLQALTGLSYSRWETAYEDEWVKRGGNVYTGKVYPGSKNTEILTMGLQRLYENPNGFAVEDPEYFDFILSVVRKMKP